MKKGSMYRDIKNIFTKEYLSGYKKGQLAGAYIKLRILRFLPKVGVGKNRTTVTLFGLRFHFKTFIDFYWTFKDNFIDEGYYFATSDATPHIIDAGANIGVTSLFFKFLYPNATITAFEPDPGNLDDLRRNIESNGFAGEITVIEKALDIEEGTVELHGTGRAITMSKEFYDMEVSSKSHYTSTDKITAQTTRLSPYVTSETSAIKLDIEGAEVPVLEELDVSGVLKNVENIVLEYHKYNRGDDSLSRVVGVLERNEFSIECLYGNLHLAQMARKDYYHIMINAKK